MITASIAIPATVATVLYLTTFPFDLPSPIMFAYFAVKAVAPVPAVPEWSKTKVAADASRVIAALAGDT